MSAVSSAEAIAHSRPRFSTRWRPLDAWLALLLPLLMPIVALLSIEVWLTITGQQRLLETLRGDTIEAVAVGYGLSILIEIGIIIWLMRLRQARISDLGLRPAKLRWYWAAGGVYLIQAIVILIIFALIDRFVPGINTQEQQSVFDFGAQGLGWWVSFAAAVVVAPGLEEIVFRGIIFAGFASRWHPVLAAAVSSLAFAFLHGQVNVAIYTFLLGLALCWLYQKSGSIWPGIVLHFANNLIAFLLLTSGN